MVFSATEQSTRRTERFHWRIPGRIQISVGLDLPGRGAPAIRPPASRSAITRYIRRGASMPRRCNPLSRTLAVTSQSRNRELRSFSPVALSTGQCS